MGRRERVSCRRLLPSPVPRGKGRGWGLCIAFIATLVAASPACGVGDFTPQTQIDGVRILASRADKPYAKPGDKVHVDVLAVDGRADRSRPMSFYWIPIVCENPLNDAYYACFAPSGSGGAGDAGGGGDGGANASGGGKIGLLRPGTDLTPFLKTGPSFDFTMPLDAVTTHPRVQGLDTPYGLAILFNVACAGHLEVTASTSSGPQQVPLGCFDASGAALDPSQYVIGYTRVYAYDARTNNNPQIAQVRFKGTVGDFADIDKNAPLAIDHCTTELRRDCPELKLDVTVTPDSWEENPSDKDANGSIRHEQIWADYYADVGQLQGGARLLYDPSVGKIDGTEITYQAPNSPGEGSVWIVVHDNRGGADWVQIHLLVR